MKAMFKLLIIYILRAYMHLLYILFPIKNNRIVFNAYSGRQYACNPKYISEYLIKHYSDKFEIIWAFQDPKKFSFLEDYNIKVVKYSSVARFYYEATCKYSVNNIGSYSWFPVRKGQEHINTWHGGFELKKCGLSEIANNNLMKKTIQMSSDNTTILLSTSRQFDRDAAVKDLGFNRETMHIGYPRNDIIIKQRNGEVNLRSNVCHELRISESDYIVLYAPTWRYDVEKKLPPIQYNKLVKAFEESTGKKISIVTRMHHLMRSDTQGMDYTIDATSYPDMQELLAVADCLITDYSSSIWDFSLTGRPIFLYVPDIEKYVAERGLHVNLFDLGFPICESNDELFQNARTMTVEKAKKAAIKFQYTNGSYEKGTACHQIADYMLQNIIMLNDIKR